jgi:hypothetical protein
MNLLKLYLLCFTLFAVVGFGYTYLPPDKNPYGWLYPIGVVPFIEGNTPGNVIVKMAGIMTGYQFGVWVAEGLQRRTFTWATFPTPTPTPKWNPLNLPSNLEPWNRLATPTPFWDSDTLDRRRLHLFASPTATATPVP